MRITTNDLDSIETQEWIDALQSVIVTDGISRANYLVDQLMQKFNLHGERIHANIVTPYCNTIKVHEEQQIPADEEICLRIGALIRWNAVAMVLRAGKYAPELGGHIASYASSAILYEVGFNYFFKGYAHPSGPDLLYIQGHASPGI